MVMAVGSLLAAGVLMLLKLKPESAYVAGDAGRSDLKKIGV
jgi:hypothetical protein